MKIVLSRKGFDSVSGGMPSPIMPDGTLLTIPIPDTKGSDVEDLPTYHDLVYEGKTYYEIIRELNPNIAEKLKNSKCHVDPDLNNRYSKKINDWKPAFGQHGIQQLHLKKNEVEIGDVFLFYGWFRQTEFDKDGKLKFVTARKDKTVNKHIIFGYMEIGEVLTNEEDILSGYCYHPHAINTYTDNNVLYLPKSVLSFDNDKKGCGILAYAPIRQLTKEGHKRSEWNLPKCFENVEISYHEKDSYGWVEGEDYFKAAYRGQEFVVKSNVSEDMMKWLKEVICL